MLGLVLGLVERRVQVGVAVEPRLRLLELGGELEQEPVGTEAADELDAEGQAAAVQCSGTLIAGRPVRFASWV